MAGLIEEFLTIWNNYSNTLSIPANESFIHKLRQKGNLEFQEKQIFIELIELMADTIYESKYGTTTHYQQTKIYEEPELNCCSKLINYLESELCWDLENEYDIAFTKMSKGV